MCADLAAAVDRLMVDSGCNATHPSPPSGWREGPSGECRGFVDIAAGWKVGGPVLAEIRERQIRERGPRCLP